MAHPSDSDRTAARQLLLYVVDQLNQRGATPSSIQLVKTIYLIDIEHQRAFQRTLTGFRWVFYRYGPYAFEIPEVAESAGFALASEEFQTGRGIGKLWRATDEAKWPAGSPFVLRALVDRVIERWALVGTRELLDYVYFHTEPMENAVRGEPLDFATVGPAIGAFEIEIRPPKALRELRARHAAFDRDGEIIEIHLTPPLDDLFFKTMDGLDSK